MKTQSSKKKKKFKCISKYIRCRQVLFEFHFCKISRTVKFIESEGTLVDARGQEGGGLGKGNGTSCLTETVSV